jgi:hypothetical protein
VIEMRREVIDGMTLRCPSCGERSLKATASRARSGQCWLNSRAARQREGQWCRHSRSDDDLEVVTRVVVPGHDGWGLAVPARGGGTPRAWVSPSICTLARPAVLKLLQFALGELRRFFAGLRQGAADAPVRPHDIPDRLRECPAWRLADG